MHVEKADLKKILVPKRKSCDESIDLQKKMLTIFWNEHWSPATARKLNSE